MRKNSSQRTFALNRKKAKGRNSATPQHTLFDRCARIANSKTILEDFGAAIAKAGLVKEQKNAKLLYLALTSRITSHPVPVVIKGASSAGKSKLFQAVANFFPETAYVAFTNMSDKALYYWEESLKNRFLVFYEAAGMNDQISYVIRTLISEGRLRRLVTVPAEGGGHTTEEIVKEGPTGVITTTTGNLHLENETRMLTLHVDETAITTKLVIKSLGKDGRAIPKSWIAFQKWIAKNNRKVVIPFWDSIGELSALGPTRLRRDFASLKELVEIHAVLHQRCRREIEPGVIEAAWEDYSVVRELVKQTISESAEYTVPKSVRETVEAVRQLKKPMVSVTEVGQQLKIHKSNASFRVKAALEAGFLVKGGNKKGSSAKLRLGEPLPEERQLLPHVKKVRRHHLHSQRMA